MGVLVVLQEIIKWSQSLPAWQQDAIARLFAKGELHAEDYDDLYALLKFEHGIPDPKGRTPKKLSADDVGTVDNADELVELIAIKNLKNVNALATGQALPIQRNGMTAIYGNNGSGKSGYSRALKKACRARDQNEVILPDAKLPPGTTGKAQATFDVLIDGNADELTWVDDAIPPEPLAKIAIFDAHCARAYLDAEDDFSYVPYGLDMLEGLAKACNRLKAMLDAEHGQLTVNPAAFAQLSSTPTAVGKLISGLSGKTKPETVEALGTVNPDEIAKHAAIEKSLKENNPKEKAALLRLRAGRFTRLAERCADKLTKVGAAQVTLIRKTVVDYKHAKEAAALAAQKFKATPGLLPGTGGEAWQALFEAARQFALHSHPDKHFPHLGPESNCPLCQQPLRDAAERLVAFDTFIQQEAEKAAREKRASAVAAYESVSKVDLNLHLDAELKAEIESISQPLATACANLQAALDVRREAIKTACGENGDWSAIGEEPASPCSDLHVIANKLVDEAAALEKAADDKARAELVTQFNELDARLQLSKVKQAVLEAIAKRVLQDKLRSCQSAVRTNSITLKSTELTQEIVSKGLADALNAEFKRLGVDELQVTLQSQSVKGKSYHKLVLQLPGAKRPMSILSEGEQRAIAIASFLAEVNVSGGRGGIVFDDPVCSLDHRRRELVAARLVEEAKTRQVVIFTHDVYFLCILQQQAEYAGVELSTLSLHRRAAGYGVADNDLPFQGAKTSARIGMLRQMHAQCAKLHKQGEEKEYHRRASDTYFHLRMAWERGIEEVLFRGVVTRFSEGIQTKKLSEVAVEDADYAAVEAGMTKCSKYAHDKGAYGNIAIPGPEELEADILALETWRKNIEDRSNVLRKKRAA